MENKVHLSKEGFYNLKLLKMKCIRASKRFRLINCLFFFLEKSDRLVDYIIYNYWCSLFNVY